jgi:hypothetical protein
VQVERLSPTRLQVIAHPVELAALVAGARWALDGAQGELPAEAREGLAKALESYDRALRGLATTPPR